MYAKKVQSTEKEIVWHVGETWVSFSPIISCNAVYASRSLRNVCKVQLLSGSSLATNDGWLSWWQSRM